jgi:hypothetical protein
MKEIPTNPDQFFIWLKAESEKLWENIELDKTIYGFQLIQGTKWLPGLDDSQIANYEKDIGCAFPEIFKRFLNCMNGTDRQTINIYGESGEPYCYGVGYYSYPRDIEVVKDKIAEILKEYQITSEDVEKQKIPHILPIVSNRFLVADYSDLNPVLSIYGNDTIIYSSSLHNFLVDDIFYNHQQETDLHDIKVKFWIN